MTNWETCVQFHGHACGGLTIGYKAACYAAELLELSFSGDEQVVCIAPFRLYIIGYRVRIAV